MAINYNVDDDCCSESPEEMARLMNLLERAVELGYHQSTSLDVNKGPGRGSVQIYSSEDYPNALFSVRVRGDTEEGRTARITWVTARDVRLQIGEEHYHIFLSKTD